MPTIAERVIEQLKSGPKLVSEILDALHIDSKVFFTAIKPLLDSGQILRLQCDVGNWPKNIYCLQGQKAAAQKRRKEYEAKYFAAQPLLGAIPQKLAERPLSTTNLVSLLGVGRQQIRNVTEALLGQRRIRSINIPLGKGIHTFYYLRKHEAKALALKAAAEEVLRNKTAPPPALAADLIVAEAISDFVNKNQKAILRNLSEEGYVRTVRWLAQYAAPVRRLTHLNPEANADELIVCALRTHFAGKDGTVVEQVLVRWGVPPDLWPHITAART